MNILYTHWGMKNTLWGLWVVPSFWWALLLNSPFMMINWPFKHSAFCHFRVGSVCGQVWFFRKKPSITVSHRIIITIYGANSNNILSGHNNYWYVYRKPCNSNLLLSKKIFISVLLCVFIVFHPIFRIKSWTC